MTATIRWFEELSLSAWPALQTVWHDGWVVRFANGYTKRANSVNPLYPATQPTAENIAACEQLFQQQGLPCVFKLTAASQPTDLDAQLAAAGYQAEVPTSVQTLALTHWPSSLHADVTFSPTVTDEWFTNFCELNAIAPTYQPTVSQLLNLIVPPKCLAVLRSNGRVLACGLAVLQGQHVGLFDIVVDPHHRRQGFGQHIVSSLLTWAQQAGAHTGYLQVMGNNAPAQALYAKLGFREAYHYWYRIAPTP